MKHRQSVVLAVVTILLAAWPGSPATARAVQPMLQFVTVQGFALSVRGTGWLPRSEVLFSVRVQNISTGIAIRATARGTFVVGVTNVTPCAGPRAIARDLSGRSVRLRSPGLGCPIPLHVNTPVLHAVSGKVLAPRTIIVAAARPASVNVPLGDELEITGRSGNATYLPTVDPRYLATIVPPDGVVPARPTTWTFLAVRPGRTIVELSPACRQATPACAIPDFALRITILPPVTTAR